MFSLTYQGKYGVEVLSSAGKDPLKPQLKLAKANGTVIREYDRTTRGYVFAMEKPSTITCIQCPASTRQSLGLTQKYLILQIKPILNNDFSFQISFLGNDNLRRRLHFSSKFKKIDFSNDLSAQLPINIDRFEGKWGNIILDMDDLANNCFRDATYASIDSVIIHPSCRMRKIFTLPTYNDNINSVPTNFEFLKGTIKAENKVYNTEEVLQQIQQQQQQLQQSQNDKENYNSTTPIKGNLSVHGTSSFGRGLKNNNKNKTNNNGSDSTGPKRRQRSWGAPSGVINTPKVNANPIPVIEEASLNSTNSATSDVNGGGSCFDAAPTAIRTPRPHLMHYDESPFKRTARKHQQKLETKKNAGREYLSRADDGGDSAGNADRESCILQEEEVKEKISIVRDEAGVRIETEINSKECELEKLPSPMLSRSVDMSQVRLSPVPVVASQTKSKMNANQMASRFAAIEISPSTSLNAPSADCDLSVPPSNSGVTTKAAVSPSAIKMNAYEISQRSHRLSVDSSCDMNSNEKERDPAAYCDFDMGRLRYSRQSHSGLIHDEILNHNHNHSENHHDNDIEMDLSHISHAASESDRSEDIPLTASIQNRYNSNTNTSANNGIIATATSTSASFHLDLEQELGRHYDRDDYDLRDQERLLEASLSEIETSGEADGLDISNNSINRHNNSDQYYQRGNNNNHATTAHSAELDDEVLMHLAARSHTLYQQQQQQPLSVSEQQHGIQSDSEIEFERQEEDCDIYSDSDSDIDIASDLPQPISSSINENEGNNMMRSSRGHGVGYTSMEKRNEDALLDSRVFGADWHLDFSFQKVSSSGRINSSRDIETERERDGDLDGDIETNEGLPYDPVAAAAAMAERMDKELDKDMVHAEEEHNAKYDYNNNHYNNTNAYDLYDIKETSMSTSNIWDRTDIELTSPASVSSGSPSGALGLSGMSLHHHQASPSYSSYSKENFGANVSNGSRSNSNSSSSSSSSSSSNIRPQTSSGSNSRSYKKTTTTSSSGRRPKSAANKDDLLDTPALDVHGLKIMKSIESRVQEQQKHAEKYVKGEILRKDPHLSVLYDDYNHNNHSNYNDSHSTSQKLSPTRMSHGTGLNTLSDIERALQQEENDFLMEYGDLSL